MSCCSMAKKSSMLSTVTSATRVQNGSPATSVSSRNGSSPDCFMTAEMPLNFSIRCRTLPGLQLMTSRIRYISPPLTCDHAHSSGDQYQSALDDGRLGSLLETHVARPVENSSAH